MLKNYLLIAIRSLQKNGVYSFINIAGLSIGLLCSILIMLWVVHELSWDDFHGNRKSISRVYLNGKGDNGAIYTQMAIPLPLWDALKTTEPGIKHVAPTNWGQTFLITYGEKRLYKEGYYAGDEFLEMFSFPVIHGSRQNQLNDPSTIVLTRSAAISLFGNENAVGKIVRVDDEIDVTVSAVLEDVPSNSTFKFECLLPFTTYMNREQWVKNSLTNWKNNSFNLYVQFHEGVDAVAVEEKVKGVINKNDPEAESEVTFLAMEKWRLYDEFKNGKSAGGAIVYVRMFGIIATFILVIACINFMNLATARSEKRAREVGIRKSIGSGRKELIFQFLGETFLIASIAFIIAVALAEIFLPLYNQLVDKELFIDYSNPVLYGIAFVVILVTGFFAGSYPAFYLSSFQPAVVLKGRLASGSRGSLPRKIMVVVQFFFSILLIICTIVIYSQLNHLQSRPTGYDFQNLVTIPNTGEIAKNFENIKRELVSKGLATHITSSSSPITAIYAFNGGLEWPGKLPEQRGSFATIAVSHDYTSTMRINVKQGRDFSENFTDSLSMILNEASVAYMGLKNPIGETITWNGEKYTVIGVTEDILMTSPTQKVHPAIFIFVPSWFSDLTLRIPAEASVINTLPKIEEVFRKFNPSYPFVYKFVDDEFNQKFVNMQRLGRLSNVFSVLAILISCLGLFGLAAFTAEQRTKEIGIRKVLGATVTGMIFLISKDFTKLVIVAFILSAPLAWWSMTNWLEQYEYRITIEWWVIALAGILSLVFALTVVGVQAFKAAISNPTQALRNE